MLCKTLVHRHTASVLLPPWTHLKYRAHFPSGLRQFLSLFSTSEYPKLLVDFIYCLSFVNKVSFRDQGPYFSALLLSFQCLKWHRTHIVTPP